MPHSAAFHLVFLKSPVYSVNRNMSLIRFWHVLIDVLIENLLNPYCQNVHIMLDINNYYIPLNDTTFELSVFCPSDTESRINELRFSESVSLSFKTRLTSVTCFAATLRKVNFKHGTRDGKHDDVTSRNET